MSGADPEEEQRNKRSPRDPLEPLTFIERCMLFDGLEGWATVGPDGDVYLDREQIVDAVNALLTMRRTAS